MAERTVDLLSVVAPVRNDEATVAACWDRVRTTLSGVPFELIFADDASSDGSPRALSKLAASDTRLKAVMLARRCGRRATIQAGLDHARGNVVAILEDGPGNGAGGLLELLSRWRAGEESLHSQRILLASPATISALPSPGQLRLARARLLAFICSGAALLAALVLLVVELVRADLHWGSAIEATVLALGAVQMAVIGVATQSLGDADGAPGYIIRERRNILPPPYPVSELEELVSELDLER